MTRLPKCINASFSKGNPISSTPALRASFKVNSSGAVASCILLVSTAAANLFGCAVSRVPSFNATISISKQCIPACHKASIAWIDPSFGNNPLVFGALSS